MIFVPPGGLIAIKKSQHLPAPDFLFCKLNQKGAPSTWPCDLINFLCQIGGHCDVESESGHRKAHSLWAYRKYTPIPGFPGRMR